MEHLSIDKKKKGATILTFNQFMAYAFILCKEEVIYALVLRRLIVMYNFLLFYLFLVVIGLPVLSTIPR